MNSQTPAVANCPSLLLKKKKKETIKKNKNKKQKGRKQSMITAREGNEEIRWAAAEQSCTHDNEGMEGGLQEERRNKRGEEETRGKRKKI